MTYDVGDLVTLTTVVKNDAGTPVNTPTLTIAVTKPDGTAVSPAPTVTNTAAGGIYTAPVTVDAAGWWTYVWTAAGSVVGKDYGQIQVFAPRALVASMEELKAHLRLTDTDTEDAKLKDVLVAVTDLMEPVVGPVTPTTFTETHYGDCIIPRRTPLASVTSITPYQGTALTSDAYRLDTDLGAIYLRYSYSYEYTLVYRAGHNPWPANLKQAGLVICQHEWSVRNGTGGRPSPDLDSLAMIPGFGFLVPHRALELMRGHIHAGVA